MGIQNSIFLTTEGGGGYAAAAAVVVKKIAFVFFSKPSGGPAKIDARMTPKQLFLPFVPEARYAEGFSSAAARGMCISGFNHHL